MSHFTSELERSEAMENAALNIALELEAMELCLRCGETRAPLAEKKEAVLDLALDRFWDGDAQMEDFKAEAEVKTAVSTVFATANAECSCAKRTDS